MKYKLIEIELTGFLYTKELNRTIEEHIISVFSSNNINTDEYKLLILSTWVEEYNSDQLKIIQESINIIKKLYDIEIVLLLGAQYRRARPTDKQHEIFQFYNADVIYIHPFPFRIYTKVFTHKISEPSDTYLPQNENKFLMLMGKPHRVHRVGLLYKLYKKGLLKHGLWRFKVHNENVKDACRKLLSHISDSEFSQFLTDCERELDNVKVEYKIDSSHYSGMPFERWIWDTVAFQVIPEVDFSDNFPSEKTWIPIINKIPFIMAAQIGHNATLRSFGFKTFEKYLLHKDYNDVSVGDIDTRLNQIVENIEYWVQNIDKFYEEIKVDVEHNFETFLKLAKEEEQKLQSIIDKYNLDCTPEELVVGYYA